MSRSRIAVLGALTLAAAGMVTGAHVIAADRGVSGPAVAVDPRDAAVTQWIGHAAVVGTWREVKQPGSDRYQAHVAGVGLVEVDAVSREVDEVVFENNLTTTARASVGRNVAWSTASSLAAAHYAGFPALQLRASSLVDHGIVAEYRFEWQGRSGDAWIPSRVTVGVNAATGRVISYWSERNAVTVPTVASVSAASARAAALRLARMPNVSVTDPSLEVVTTAGGMQRLVWVTQVTEVFSGGAHIPNSQVFWTDGRTGQTSLVART